MSEEKFASEWEDLTVVQLKEELQGRGLEITGRKAELVARLEEHDRQLLQMQPDEVVEADKDGEKDEEKEEETDFVVWADDADEMLDEDKKRELMDKAAADESNNVTDGQEKNAEDDAKVTTNKEFNVEVSKDKDQFILTWHGQKIIVPFKDEVQKDLKHFSRQQNIIVYPAEVGDIYHESIRPLVETAINVSMEMDETMPGTPIRGYLRLKFGSNSEATYAMEVLKELAPEGRELTIQHFGENDSEGHVLSKVKSKETVAKDTLIQRLMFVSNFPCDVTEANIKEHFTDALRVIVPSREDTSDKIGYAYLEYPTEAAVLEAVANFKDTEMSGQMLYVIKAMTDKKEAFGLLRDNLRKYWLEQVRSFEAVKANPNNNKSVRELRDIDQKLNRYKKRVDKDNRKRAELGLPIPENEEFHTKDTESDKEESKEKDKEPVSTVKSKSIERRKSNPVPPRRRFSPPSSRGSSFNSRYSGRGGGYRGGPSSFGPSSRAAAGNRPEHLMNQLQELVGALAHKLPAESSRFDYNDGGYGSGSRSSSYYDSRGGSRGGFGGGYRGDYGSSGGRFEGKRPSDSDYGGDRKRRPDDDYPRFGGGRGSDYGGSYGGGSRRGGYNY